MGRRVHLGALVAAALLSLTVLPVSSQTEAIELTLKVARGETLYYSDTASMQITVDMPGNKATIDFRIESRQAQRILDVDTDGVILVEIAAENSRYTLSVRTEQIEVDPSTFRVRPDGRVVEKLVNAEIIDDFPFPLPDRPVKVGESWSRERKLTISGMTGQGASTFTLVAVDPVAGGRVARIRSQADGTVISTGASPLPPGAQVRGTFRATGETLWSVDRGRPVRSTLEMTMDYQLELTVQGQTNRSRGAGKFTTLSEALAAESVTIPSVSPDLQIVPGRGFGTFTLVTSVPNLTTRLGSPNFGEDLGFRAPSLLWPNGLVGYVDEDDRDKLVGLEITDRRYRAEKNIGVGSTRGAVLIAYGLSPTKVEMSIPRHGSVRVLIYNDQGIAFAIASDKHIGTGSQHPPIGAVDWITVFPQGGAAKIFPMP